MKILAIDTSTESATVAVTEDERLLGTETLCLKKSHSQIIMVMIEDLLKKLELDISDIDLFAAAHGPGSFTGLRVGIAAIKGLADGTGKPSFGVSTLKAMADPYSATVCPIIDARREQVYFGLYRQGNSLIADGIKNITELCNELKKRNEKILFTGNCIGKYKQTVKEILGENSEFVEEAYNFNNAVNVANTAKKDYDKTKKSGISPEYIIKAYVEQ